MGADKLTKLVPGPLEAMSGHGARAGNPLPATLRHHWETTMSQNFADVRVHEGHQATLVGADAFTSGRDIFVRAGKYQPLEENGRMLIAHELTHVVQQGNPVEQIRVPQGMVEVSGGPSPSTSEEPRGE